jgi:hypothetical protein
MIKPLAASRLDPIDFHEVCSPGALFEFPIYELEHFFIQADNFSF